MDESWPLLSDTDDSMSAPPLFRISPTPTPSPQTPSPVTPIPPPLTPSPLTSPPPPLMSPVPLTLAPATPTLPTSPPPLLTVSNPQKKIITIVTSNMDFKEENSHMHDIAAVLKDHGHHVKYFVDSFDPKNTFPTVNTENTTCANSNLLSKMSCLRANNLLALESDIYIVDRLPKDVIRLSSKNKKVVYFKEQRTRRKISRVERIAETKADKVVVPSQEMFDIVAGRAIGHHKVKVLYPNSKYFLQKVRARIKDTQSKQEVNSCLRKVRTRTNKLYAVFVERAKDFQYVRKIVEAMASIIEERKKDDRRNSSENTHDILFIVYRKKNFGFIQRAKIRSISRIGNLQNKNVYLWDYTLERMCQLFHHCDCVFYLPNQSVKIPLTAMLCRKPLIAFQETEFIQDLLNGWIVEIDEVADLIKERYAVALDSCGFKSEQIYLENNTKTLFATKVLSIVLGQNENAVVVSEYSDQEMSLDSLYTQCSTVTMPTPGPSSKPDFVSPPKRRSTSTVASEISVDPERRLSEKAITPSPRETRAKLSGPPEEDERIDEETRRASSLSNYDLAPARPYVIDRRTLSLCVIPGEIGSHSLPASSSRAPARSSSSDGFERLVHRDNPMEWRRSKLTDVNSWVPRYPIREERLIGHNPRERTRSLPGSSERIPAERRTTSDEVILTFDLGTNGPTLNAYRLSSEYIRQWNLRRLRNREPSTSSEPKAGSSKSHSDTVKHSSTVEEVPKDVGTHSTIQSDSKTTLTPKTQSAEGHPTMRQILEAKDIEMENPLSVIDEDEEKSSSNPVSTSDSEKIRRALKDKGLPLKRPGGDGEGSSSQQSPQNPLSSDTESNPFSNPSSSGVGDISSDSSPAHLPKRKVKRMHKQDVPMDSGPSSSSDQLVPASRRSSGEGFKKFTLQLTERWDALKRAKEKPKGDAEGGSEDRTAKLGAGKDTEDTSEKSGKEDSDKVTEDNTEYFTAQDTEMNTDEEGPEIEEEHGTDI